ncbi:MAG: hypothetical protein M3Z49_13665, partial [Bifidobacteriales bacterium]|nr:hypothetical protein [Bifidobacteriales bacterium]
MLCRKSGGLIDRRTGLAVSWSGFLQPAKVIIAFHYKFQKLPHFKVVLLENIFRAFPPARNQDQPVLLYQK